MMRKPQLFLVLAGACIIFCTGCASTKATYQRGWIGGKYLESNTSLFKEISNNYFKTDTGVIPALPSAVKREQPSAVLVSRVYDNTPTRMAGIREGDLITRINGEKVEHIKDLRRVVDKSEPGTKIVLTIYRDDSVIDIPVVVGKETYQEWHRFAISLQLGTDFDPIPHPEFNLLGLIKYETNETRVELESPEYKYFDRAHRTVDNAGDKPGYEFKANCEGWDTFFGIFGFSGNKVILTQDVVGS